MLASASTPADRKARPGRRRRSGPRVGATACCRSSSRTGRKTALREIVTDMQRPEPMNRLLQGDVGAGKTIVALLAAVVAMENRLQVAFMAPTEILADQHYLTIRRLLDQSRFRVALLTGSATAAKRREMLRRARERQRSTSSSGTHALVEGRRVPRARAGDHRRAASLRRHAARDAAREGRASGRAGDDGDADSAHARAHGVRRSRRVGHPRPAAGAAADHGRSAAPESRRDDVYELARRELEAGRQVYVIYPLVEESEKVDLRAATAMADTLQAEVFPEYRVALLHGRLKPDEKDRVMAAFARGDVHVLVSTTVVEVGVDVPNATLMIVEHAERFGLSQLHQLRGRVGRGEHPSTCVLLYQHPLSDPGARVSTRSSRRPTAS